MGGAMSHRQDRVHSPSTFLSPALQLVHPKIVYRGSLPFYLPFDTLLRNAHILSKAHHSVFFLPSSFVPFPSFHRLPEEPAALAQFPPEYPKPPPIFLASAIDYPLIFSAPFLLSKEYFVSPAVFFPFLL